MNQTKLYCCIFFLILIIYKIKGSILNNDAILKKNLFKHNRVQFDQQQHKNNNQGKSTPPDHKQYIAMARYIMHQADWVSIATLSQISNVKGYPFTSIVSMSDGTVQKSIGIPYFYLTPLDFPSIDLQIDPRCTISATLEQTDFCRSNDYVPDDPRCARVMLSGHIKRVKNDTAEYDFAKEALFTRHHSMADLPKDHGFYVAKLDIAQIVMLDWFGGPIYINLQDYLAYKGVEIFEERFDSE